MRGGGHTYQHDRGKKKMKHGNSELGGTATRERRNKEREEDLKRIRTQVKKEKRPLSSKFIPFILTRDKLRNAGEKGLTLFNFEG